jgi:predicted deacylase
VEGLGDRPGRLLATSGAAGRVAVELEVGGEGISVPARREACLGALRRILAHAGIAGAATAPAGSASVEILRHLVEASRTGLLRRMRECGDQVVAGEPLAEVTDTVGRTLEVVSAPTDGVLGLVRETCHISSGELVAGVYVEAD